MRAMMIAAAVLFAAPAMAQPTGFSIPSGAYVGDPAHTSVTFKIKHFGLSFYTARFAKVESKVMLDAARPSASSVAVSIDAKSVKTDFPFPDQTDFDKEIGTEKQFLDGNAHPTISFVSRSIRQTGPNAAEISGDLTLKGVTKPIVLQAVLNGDVASHPMRKVPMFGISAIGTIKRQDFGLSVYPGVLGDDVLVMIESEYAPAAK